VRFRALEIGVATIGGYEIKDIRFKGRGSLPGRTIFGRGSNFTFTDIESGVLGFAFETPVGALNNSNRVFTVQNVPLYVVVNGAVYFEGAGYTLDGLTITLNGPVGVGSNKFIRSFYR